MFVKKSPQKTLFEPEFMLPESKRKRMYGSWADVFRSEIMPELVGLEAEFAHKYHQTLGAPNKPVALMLGIKILQNSFDMSNIEVAEQVDFSLLWHHALEIETDRAHVCVKTIYNFDQFLKTDDLAQKVFERITDLFIEKFNIRTTHQRLDSTHVLSNMAKMNRLGLFIKTLEQFLKKLRRKYPSAFEALPASLPKRYLDREGYFADVKGSQAQSRLEQCAEDIYVLVERFRKTQTVSRLQAYKNLARLLKDQCDVINPEENADGEAAQRVAIKNPKDVAADSLQNPSDPDATFSRHKGKGYQAQIAETCHEDNAFEMITFVETEGAHESDQNEPSRVHENLINRGLAPETTFVDSGYISGENIIEAQKQGIDLQGPTGVGSKPDPEKVPLSDFQFNAEGTRIDQCPAGHAPLTQRDTTVSDGKPGTISHFDKDICDRCELKTTCRSKEQVKSRVLCFSPSDVVVAQRRAEQETAEFKTAYKIRSGIEATNGHLKNDRGMRRLRTRGSPSVSLSVFFKCLAENCHRVVNYTLKEVKKKQKSPITA